MAGKKILITIQFWSGDRELAMGLGQLLARLEPKYSELADVLFVPREDPPDRDVVETVSRRFKTFIYRPNVRAVGWPHAPNAVWFATMEWVWSMQRAKRTNYKAVLTTEGDGCPLAPDWIARLSEEWDKAKARVVGPYLTTPMEHINGNAMLSTDPEFLHWIARQVGGVPAWSAWDCHLARDFAKRGWRDCPIMKSHWRTPTMPAEQIEALIQEGVVFLHGVKDRSVQDYVAKKYFAKLR